jgi:hypothetical protein
VLCVLCCWLAGQVVVENLPPGTSWQDLKDFMRKAGDVGFSEVNREGTPPPPHPRTLPPLAADGSCTVAVGSLAEPGHCTVLSARVVECVLTCVWCVADLCECVRLLRVCVRRVTGVFVPVV